MWWKNCYSLRMFKQIATCKLLYDPFYFDGTDLIVLRERGTREHFVCRSDILPMVFEPVTMKPRVYRCRYCDMRYPNPTTRYRHEREHNLHGH